MKSFPQEIWCCGIETICVLFVGDAERLLTALRRVLPTGWSYVSHEIVEGDLVNLQLQGPDGEVYSDLV